jgi:hypothetical protein
VNLLQLLTVLLTLAASARGVPSAEEQRLFAEGLKAFDAGDARAAERAWKEGYAVAHDPAFLVRIGEAEEKAGAPAEAADTYRRYLREAPDAADRADIEQRLARLAPPGAAPAPSAAHEPAEPTHEFGAAPTASDAPAPTTSPASTAAPPPVVARGVTVGDTESAGGPNAAQDSGWNRYNVTAMTATGVTVILLGAAAFFAAEASSKEGDVDRLLTNRDEATGAPVAYSTVAGQYQSALSDGRRDARDAKLALAGAAGAAVVAAVFFVLDGLHPAEASVALAPTPEGAGAVGAFAWTF